MTLRGKTSLISPNLYDKLEPNPTLINSIIQCSYSKVIGMNKILDFNIYMLNVRIKFLDLLFLFVKAWFPITMTRGCVMKTKFNLGMSFNVGDCLHYQSVQEVVSYPIVYTSISIVCTFVCWSYFFDIFIEWPKSYHTHSTISIWSSIGITLIPLYFP